MNSKHRSPAPQFRRHPIARQLLQMRWALLTAAWLPLAALANPTDGVVVGGDANAIITTGAITTIEQFSQTAIINWSQFNVDSGEQVIFDQPSASAAVLNRVTGGIGSEIFGTISGNGRVFLVNPNGVLIGSTGQIDVQGLVISTLGISDADFRRGTYRFTAAPVSSSPSPKVENEGRIQIRPGGFVVLAGDTVVNAGAITVPELVDGETGILLQTGEVLMASGGRLSLMLDPEGLVSYDITAAASASSGGVSTLSESSINAPAGDVYLSGFANSGTMAAAVNHDGDVSARTIQENNGVILLEGQAGDVISTGDLDASADNGNGGTVYVLSDATIHVSSRIDASGSSGGGDIRIGSSDSDLPTSSLSDNQITTAANITLESFANLTANTAPSGSEFARLFSGRTGTIALTAITRIDLTDTTINGDLVRLVAPIISNFSSSSESSPPTSYINGSQIRIQGEEISLADTSFYIQPNGSSFNDRLNFGFFNTGIARALYPDDLTPDLVLDATSSLSYFSIDGAANYIVLRAPLAFVADFGSVFGSANLFLQYTPAAVDNASNFDFELPLLGFANNARSFGFGGSRYGGDVFIGPPGTTPLG